MSECTPIPTATQFETISTNSLSTSLSESVTTIPASTTIIETSTCSSASSGVTDSDCSTTEITSTISPAQVLTTQVQVVITVPVVTTTPTATLFSTSCTDTGVSSSSTSSSSTSSSSSSSSITTLPPTTSLSIISSSSTLPGGSVIIVSSTLTTVVTPTSAVPVPGHHSSSSNLGAIVGGAVGGAVALAAVILLAWFIIRKKRKNRDDDFDPMPGKIHPYPIRLTKTNGGNGMTLDDPNPFDPYNGGETSPNIGTASPEGVSAAIAGPPTTSTVRRRTATSPEGFPNPYSSIPTTSDDYGPSASPPAPIGEGSIFSAPSAYSQASEIRRPLRVTNPEAFMPMPVPIPLGDTKDRSIFLTPERGLQVRGGPQGVSSMAAGPSIAQASQAQVHMPVPFADESTTSGYGASSDAGTSSAHAGSTAVPFVHRDGGPLAASSDPPQESDRSKEDEAHDDAAQHSHPDAPPAYEA